MISGKKIILQKGKGAFRKQAKLAYIYEKSNLYFAQISESIRDLAIEELRELGATQIRPVFRGVWFSAAKKDFYRITYSSRLISRILAPLSEFECKDKDDLYKAARKIRWEEFMTPKKTFSVVANVSEATISHSNFAGLRVKDAIADYFRDRTNRRPNVDGLNPYLTVNIHLHKDKATLSIDISGGPLHRRGYREMTVAAPMQETVAASIIRLSKWDGTKPLVDPMCGSGTLLSEALMHHCRIPAQIFREHMDFERLPDFDAELWDKVRQEAVDGIRPLEKGMICGSDLNEDAVAAARTNIMGLHYGGEVDIRQSDFRDIEGINDSVIVTNPPYGIRIGTDLNLNKFYQDIGTFFKTRCQGSTAYVYFGEPKFIKKVPLAPAFKYDLKIGGLSGKLVKYQIY